MLKIKLVLALPLLALSLMACNTTDDLYTPVESPEIVNKLEPTIVWEQSTGGTSRFTTKLSPAIEGKILYMASRNGYVAAYDKLTGENFWRIDLEDQDENSDKRSSRLSGGVTAYKGLLAVGSENGYVYVLDAKNGALRNKFYIGAEILVKPEFNKSGTRIFVLDANGSVSAFDLATQDMVFVSGESSSKLHLRSQSDLVVIGDEYVLAGLSNGKINILDQNNGAIANQITVSQQYGTNSLQRMDDIASTPYLKGRYLYAISYKGGLIKYDFKDHAIVTKLGYESSKDMALDDDYMIIVDDMSHIYAISLKTNQELWNSTALTHRGVTAPAIYGNYAVVGDYEGYLYFLSLSDGKIAAKMEIDSSAIYGTPLVDEGNLYVFSKDGALVCLNYDPRGVAADKFRSMTVAKANLGRGLKLAAPGIGQGGIYAPHAVDRSKLLERRRQIIKAVAQAESQQRQARAKQQAYEKQKAEYERRQKVLEEERRRQMGGFGI